LDFRDTFRVPSAIDKEEPVDRTGRVSTLRKASAAMQIHLSRQQLLVVEPTVLSAADPEQWFALGLVFGAYLLPGGVANFSAGPVGERPSWDNLRRQLKWRSRVLCTFRRRASAPVTILSAFERTGWREGLVPDPLPPLVDPVRARRRLEMAVKNLNRRLPKRTLRFRHDAGAGGVWWESCPTGPPSDSGYRIGRLGTDGRAELTTR
jgi:hypothetical protein